MRRLSSFLTPSTPHTIYQSALKSTHHWCIFIHHWSIFQLRFRRRDNKRGWRTLMVLTAFLQQNKVAQHKSLWHTLWYINGFICIIQWCLSIKRIFDGIALLLQMSWCWGPTVVWGEGWEEGLDLTFPTQNLLPVWEFELPSTSLELPFQPPTNNQR